MKKILLLALLVLSLGLLAGCSDTSTQAKSDAPEQQKKDISKEVNPDFSSDKSENIGQKGEEKAQDEPSSNSNESADAKKEEPKNTLKEGSRAGNLARDVEFELWEDGKTVKLSDYKGEAVVLNFWTSWCPYCVDELPALNDAYNEYKEKGIKVIAINLAFQDDANAAKKAMENVGAEFVVANDNSGQVASAFGVRSIPVSVFIDKDGVIYDNVTGAMDKDAFLSYMKEITKEITE